MRFVRPYRTLMGAKRALDNGGRFYNLLSRAGDDHVTGGELSRAAGVHSLGTAAFLHLDMALSELPERECADVVSLLAPRLRERYRAAAAPRLAAAELERHAKPGRAVIVEGLFTYREEEEALTGMIIVPLQGGSMVAIPVYERYRLFSVSSSPKEDPSPVLVAAPKSSRDLAGLEIRLGGEFKEIDLQRKKKREKALFLDAMYYTYP